MTLVSVEDKFFNWASYAWDMKRTQLTIHAPGNSTGAWDAYDNIKCILNTALRRCIETFFDGWAVDWENWPTVYTTTLTLARTPCNK